MAKNHIRAFVFDAGTNYLRMAVTITGTLLLTRSMALRWGATQFGEWTLLTTVMSLTLLLDFGLSNVVLKVAGNAHDSVNGALSSILAALSVVSVAAFAVLVPCTFAVMPAHSTSLLLAGTLLGLRATLATLPWTVYRSALYARGQMARVNAYQMANTLAYSLGASWFIQHGGGIAGVALLTLSFSVVDSTVLSMLLRRHAPQIVLSFHFSWRELKPLFSLSGASLLINLSGFILLKTDPLIVKSALPFSQVAMYAVALRIAENIFLLCKQLVNALTPHAVRVAAATDATRRGRMFDQASRYVLALGAPLYVCSVVLGRDGIRFWLSAEYESSALLLRILLLAMVLSIPQMVASNLLTFSGKQATTATYITAGAFLNVAASFLLVHLMGASGVAFGTLVTTLIIDVGIAIPLACRSFQMSLRQYVWDVVRCALLPSFVQFVALLGLHRLVPPSSLLGVVAEGVASLSCFAIAFTVMGSKAGERARLKAALLPGRTSLITTQIAEEAG